MTADRPPQPGTGLVGLRLVIAESADIAVRMTLHHASDTIAFDLRHRRVAGDIALLTAAWTLTRTGPGGEREPIGGTATDVARRDADGCWRYVIDNPFDPAR